MSRFILALGDVGIFACGMSEKAPDNSESVQQFGACNFERQTGDPGTWGRQWKHVVFSSAYFFKTRNHWTVPFECQALISKTSRRMLMTQFQRTTNISIKIDTTQQYTRDPSRQEPDVSLSHENHVKTLTSNSIVSDYGKFVLRELHVMRRDLVGRNCVSPSL